MRIPTAVFVVLSVFSLQAADRPSLTLVKTVSLPGVKGRFDHFTIDSRGHRLFVAALGNNTVEAIDLEGGRHLKSIGGLHKPTGLLFVPEKNHLAVANGDDGTLKIYDAASFDLRSTIRSLDDADNVRYDAKTKLIYVGYGSGALAVVDAETLKQTGSIKLDAHPESFQLEKDGIRIYVNLPDSKKVVVINREKRTIENSWPMKDATANFPMALDEAHHRLFVGCRQPARLVVIDTSTGMSVGVTSVCNDTDDLFHDARRNRVYLSCGGGFIDIVETDANQYKLREQLPTRGGARTSFFSPALDGFYLAVPQRNGQDAEIRIYQPN
jgi:hypothetical protein